MTRRLDAAETITNTVSGVIVGFLINLLLLPVLGVETTVASAGGITVIYIITSSLRAYVLRRLFRAISEQPKRFRCKICDDLFKTYSARKAHENEHKQ